MKRLLASLVIATFTVGSVAVTHAQPVAALSRFSYRYVCGSAAPGYARCFAIQRIDNLHADASSPGGFNPPDLQSAYNVVAAAASQGQGQVLADVLWFDDPNAESDMNHYRAQFGLPPCTTANGCFKKVDQNGGTTYPKANASSALEISLDLDMFSAICPNCKIVLVEAATNSNANIDIAEDQAVAQGATVISNSYGGPESASNPTVDDLHYNHPGVVITVSAGDHGYSGLLGGPQWPAASPHVTSVGGTSLYKTSAVPRGWYETVWSCKSSFGCLLFGGTNSGCSKYEAKPSWQHDASCAKRTIGDVSAVANPATGLSVYDTYNQSGWLVVGGTSASSPIVAGIYALAGNGASLTYGSYPYSHNSPSTLNDVTVGLNGSCGGSYLCTAKPGYDGPTGLGTPNGTGAF